MKTNTSVSLYNKYRNLVNDHILDYMPEIDGKCTLLYEAMKYSLLAGGKRIRPVLLLGAFEICDKPISFALPYACAAEYIHTYSLIHDDLPAMDNDDYRRGKLTNHKVYGEDIAILAGDGLLSAAYEIMTKNMLMYLDDTDSLKCIVKATFCLSKGTGVRGMVAGQVADVSADNSISSSEMLEFIHINKTAAFIRACVKAGGYLAGHDQSVMNDLECYGENLGMAFQVVDDILDITSTKEELGHSIGKDEEDNKLTYPALYGLDKSKSIAIEYLKAADDAISKYFDNAEVLKYVIEMLKSEIE